MIRSPEFGQLSAVVVSALLLGVVLPAGRANPEPPPEGRFLYTGDDDWDWASPLGVAVPCKLSKHGTMPWSALDWAEEGLTEVRGVLVGLPPRVGNSLTMEELAAMRGRHTTYRHEVQKEGVIARALAADPSPNLILLTQLSRDGGRLADEDVRSLVQFVKSGGRLLVLDDSACYSPLMDAVIDIALELAKAGLVPPVAVRIDAAFAERVAGLVRALGSPDFRTRESATAELVELGTPALELAAEIPSDDPELAARVAKVRAMLKPTGGVITNDYRRKKQDANDRRVAGASAKLKGAGFPHRVDTVYADAEGAPLASLKLVVPAK